MSPVQILQREIFERLDADAYFADIPMTVMLPLGSEDSKLVVARYQKAQAGELAKAGKYGVAIFIELPDDEMTDETIGPRFTAVPEITIIERPEVNYLSTGTGKSGSEVAHHVVQVLGMQGVGGLGDDLAFGTFTKLKIVNPIELTSPRETVVKGEIQVQPRPLSRCAQVKIEAAGLSVTLSTATAGATIYYTTDGSFPYAGNAAAVAYAAPFDVTSGTTVRAVAHKAGQSASQNNFKRISS